MQYIIELDKAVNFAPSNEIEEILQNIRTIISTVIWSVPLYRDFALNVDYLDSPLPVAKSLAHGAIIDAINEFEPRAEVISVEFADSVSDAMNGVLSPIVTVEIRETSEREV